MLRRKFYDTGTYPVYEDRDVTVLSSEMLRYFALDGVELYHSPKHLTIDPMDVQQYGTETTEGLESIVRSTFEKRQLHADLWYGRN